jgi:hypothetical protein
VEKNEARGERDKVRHTHTHTHTHTERERERDRETERDRERGTRETVRSSQTHLTGNHLTQDQAVAVHIRQFVVWQAAKHYPRVLAQSILLSLS